MGGAHSTVPNLFRPGTLQERRACDALQELPSSWLQEFALRAFLALPDVGVAVLDRDFRCAYVNQELSRMDRRSVEEHLGRRVREIVPQWANCIEWNLRSVLASGEPLLNLKAALPAENNRVAYFRVCVFPLGDTGGVASALGAVVVETTIERRMEHRLRALRRRLRHAREEEERRLVRELHDSTAQELALLEINLGRLARLTSGSPGARELVRQSKELAASVARQLRTLSYLPRVPLVSGANFTAILRGYLAGFSERSGILVNFEAPEELPAMPARVQCALVRIVQECLTNVLRHSRSPTAEISLSCRREELHLEVRDLGIGMPKLAPSSKGAQAGVGLAGIGERAREMGGCCVVQSAPGCGTLVRVMIPLRRTREK